MPSSVIWPLLSSLLCKLSLSLSRCTTRLANVCDRLSMGAILVGAPFLRRMLQERRILDQKATELRKLEKELAQAMEEV